MISKEMDHVIAQMKRQSAELEAADKMADALLKHRCVAVVDDDYPEVRHNYESALADFIASMKKNGRFAEQGNRYGLVELSEQNIACSAPVKLLEALQPVFDEITKAVQKFPTWPTDPLHALGVLNEEVGELDREIMHAMYEPEKGGPDDVRAEAVQAAAMAIRFFLSLDVYDYTPGQQHKQSALSGNGPA